MCEATFRFANEFYQPIHILVSEPPHFGESIRLSQRRSKQNSVRLLQRLSCLIGKAGSAQTYGINSSCSCRVSISDEERQYILHDLGFAAHHRVTTKPYKLMGANVVGKEDVILNLNVPCQRYPVGKNIAIADHTVMSYVNSNHKQVF
jgi:hypothetical protein